MPGIGIGIALPFITTMGGGGSGVVLSQYTATELDDFTLTISGPALAGATSVEAFDNGVSIGTDAAAPFTYSFVDIAAGSHVITISIDGAAQRAAGTITVTAGGAPGFIQVSAGGFIQVSAGNFIQIS